MPGAPRDRERVSHGAVRAAFNAFGTAGRVILHRPGQDRGVPADADIRGIIRPISGTVFDGRHYCALDWHVLMLAWIDGGDRDYSHADAEAALGPIVTELILDGAPLVAERSPIKPFLAPEAPPVELERAFFFNVGALRGPGELAVGSHTFGYRAVFGDGSTESDEITFVVDAPGTGTCAWPPASPSGPPSGALPAVSGPLQPREQCRQNDRE